MERGFQRGGAQLRGALIGQKERLASFLAGKNMTAFSGSRQRQHLTARSARGSWVAGISPRGAGCGGRGPLSATLFRSTACSL
jgi:hypothetical protein